MIINSHYPDIGKTWINYPPPLKKTQIGQFRFAPIVSTPFPKNRYQILATFWERCHYFCQGSSHFFVKLEKTDFFYVLHNAFTTFAPHIRGPPHLELLYTNSNDWR